MNKIINSVFFYILRLLPGQFIFRLFKTHKNIIYPEEISETHGYEYDIKHIDDIHVIRVIELYNGFSSYKGDIYTYNGGIIIGYSSSLKECKNTKVVHASSVKLWKLKSSIKYLPGVTVVLTWDVNYQLNYFHWIFDILPKLMLLQNRYNHIDYVFCMTTKDFHLESLRLLGFGEKQIIDASTHNFIQAEKLVCIKFYNAFSSLSKWMVDCIKTQLLPIALSVTSPEKNGLSRKIYISRNDANVRRIENESDLTYILKKYDFVEINLSDFSFVEQVNLFHSADVVVGPHGAGLSNIVFCKPGTTVIEIFPSIFSIDLYKKLALLSELSYFKFSGKASDSMNNYWRFRSQNFSVDIHELDNFLKIKLGY